MVQDLTSSITGAHFHLGQGGINGPVLEAITVDSDGIAVGAWMDLTETEMHALEDEEIYVNVHTSLYSDGEVRGQVR